MQVPQWLLDVIDKCLQKSPDARFNSGVELHDAIINGSLAADGRLSTTAIQAENERLQHMVAHYQQDEVEKDKQLSSLKNFSRPDQAGVSFNAMIRVLMSAISQKCYYQKARLAWY
jgi:serine/threonine protein kinase